MTTTDSGGTRRNKRIVAFVLIGIAGIFLLSIVVARLFVFDLFRVSSMSMYPTIPQDSLVVVDKRGFAHAIPKRLFQVPATARPARGDVVASYVDDEIVFLMRVMGLPGEHVVVRDRRVIIDGVAVETTPGRSVGRYRHATESFDGRTVSIAWLPERPSTDFDGVVPEDHYFALGDSRDNARDSRFPDIGYVSTDDIIGRVVKVLSVVNVQDPLAEEP